MADGLGEVEPALLASVKSAVGKDLELDFVKKVKVELKGERTEGRVLALSAYRLYTLASSKIGCKIESSIHILGIQGIESSKPLVLNISTGDKSYCIRVSQPNDCIEIIAHIVAALKSTFPAGNPDRLLRLTFGTSGGGEERQQQVTTLVNNLRNAEADAEVGPCGGFSRVYACMCDYYGVQYLEEVTWDVDTIYLSHDTKEFSLQDFDHLDQKDLIPIISALEYNSWFTKLVCRSSKLGSEACDVIVRLLKKSSVIEEIVLDGISMGRDYFQKLALALTSNPKSAINSIDFSNNSMEDRGLSHLTGTFSKLSQGLVSLVLIDNGLTVKSSLLLGQALKNSKHMDSSLKRLNLSKNPLKAEGVGALSDFLAKPNALTHLDLSYTDCCLDVLFGALMRGCVQNLLHLNLAGNNFTARKKEISIPQSFQQLQETKGRQLTKFFSMSQVLKFVDISDCKLPADAVRAILLGLSENKMLAEIELNISKNELKSAGAVALTEFLSKVKNIKKLDISDNGFEGDLVKVLESLGSNQSIQHLCVGQNFRQRNSNVSLEALVQLISEENSHIHTLSIADSKLKHEIIPLLDALGTNETLVELDISGNNMGDEGARILAKALQLNSKLRKLHWDRNGTTHRGLGDISAALESNHILHSMPTPLHDAAQCIKSHSVQCEQHLRKIEKLLLRNQSPHKVVTEQAYRLQQGLLMASTQQQAVDRLIVQLQDLIYGLRNSKDAEVKVEVAMAKQYIQDADKLKQLLLKFQLCTDDSDVEAKFAELTVEFYQTSQEKMKNNMEQILKCAREVCPYITSKEDVKSSLTSLCEGKQRLSQTFVEEVIMTQAAAAILNRLSEDKLTVASIIADTILDMVIRYMDTSGGRLDLLLKEHRKKEALADEDEKGLGDTDDVAVAAKKARNRLSSAQFLSAGENTEEVPKSHKRRPTISRARHKASLSEEVDIDLNEGGKEVQDGGVVIIDKEVKKSPMVTKKVKAPAPPNATDLDLSVVEQKGSDLNHIVKSRARPARGRRLPTRPSNRPQIVNGTEKNEKNDEKEASIDSFWSTTQEELAKPEPKVNVPSKPVPSKTPPKPAPKPKPKPAPKQTDESKKSGWMPKGGINIGLPGFFKKKRDRSGSGQEGSQNAGMNSRWYTNKNAVSEARITSSLPNLAPPKTADTSPPAKPAPPRTRMASGVGPKPAIKPRDRTTTAPIRPPVPQTRDRAAASSSPVKESKEEDVQQKSAARGPPRFGVGIGGLAGGGLLAEMKLRQERGGSFGDKANKPQEKETKPERKPSTEEISPQARPRVPTGERENISEEGLVRPSSIKRPRLPSITTPKPYVKPREKPKKEDEKKEQVKKEEAKKEEGKKEQVKKEQVNKEEAKKEQVKKEEAKKDEVKKEDEKKEQVKKEEAKKDKVKKEDEKKEQVKKEEAKKEAKKEDVQPEKSVRRKPSHEGKDDVDAGKKEEEKTESVDDVEASNDKLKPDKSDDSDLWVKRDLPSPKRSPRSPREKSPPPKVYTTHPLKPEKRPISPMKPEKRPISPMKPDKSPISPMKPDKSPISPMKPDKSPISPMTRAATLPKPWSPSVPTSRSLPRKFSWEADKKTEDLFRNRDEDKKEEKKKDEKSEENVKRKDSIREENEEEIENGVVEDKMENESSATRTSPSKEQYEDPFEEPSETKEEIKDECDDTEANDKLVQPIDSKTPPTVGDDITYDPLGVLKAQIDDTDTVP